MVILSLGFRFSLDSSAGVNSQGYFGDVTVEGWNLLPVSLFSRTTGLHQAMFKLQVGGGGSFHDECFQDKIQLIQIELVYEVPATCQALCWF